MDAIQYLIQAQALCDRRQYERALSLIVEAEAAGKACTDSLILKGVCIQYADQTGLPVDSALQIQLEVLATQPQNARASLEAGFFLLNVSDAPERTIEYFRDAATSYEQRLEEALVGAAESAIEAGEQPVNVMQEMDERLQKLLDRIRQKLAGPA